MHNENGMFPKADIPIIQIFSILFWHPLLITDRVEIFELFNDHKHHVDEISNFAKYLIEIVYGDRNP